uniref:Uncharacterized protein n=1 Tax=Anguilla anguilla TaxID=7936 RepID=A0A0E9RDY4_ANGAN
MKQWIALEKLRKACIAQDKKRKRGSDDTSRDCCLQKKRKKPKQQHKGLFTTKTEIQI